MKSGWLIGLLGFTLGPMVAPFLLSFTVYRLALLGLAVFYSVKRTTASRGQHRPEAEGDVTGEPAFWLSTGSFAVYNVVIGYVLRHRIGHGLPNLILFAVAMGLHFVVNDDGLRERHKASYTRVGRWVFAAAVFLGWGLGVVTEISET